MSQIYQHVTTSAPQNGQIIFTLCMGASRPCDNGCRLRTITLRLKKDVFICVNFAHGELAVMFLRQFRSACEKLVVRQQLLNLDFDNWAIVDS